MSGGRIILLCGLPGSGRRDAKREWARTHGLAQRALFDPPPRAG